MPKKPVNPAKGKTDLIEDGLRRINRKSIAAGFGPLTIKELDAMLTKLATPKALPQRPSGPQGMPPPSALGMAYGR